MVSLVLLSKIIDFGELVLIVSDDGGGGGGGVGVMVAAFPAVPVPGTVFRDLNENFCLGNSSSSLLFAICCNSEIF